MTMIAATATFTLGCSTVIPAVDEGAQGQGGQGGSLRFVCQIPPPL